MNYKWPASRLTKEDIHALHLLRLETKKPITVLLHEAVSALYNALRGDDHGEKETNCPDEDLPQMQS